MTPRVREQSAAAQSKNCLTAYRHSMPTRRHFHYI